MKNNMEDIKILARDLSQKMHIQIIFEKDATPMTNGSEIILPENFNKEMLFELLGALLHETGHIRYTDFRAHEYQNLSGFENDAFQVLEDIRVDHKTIEKYPAAIELYTMLIEYVSRSRNMKDEPLAVRILKHLYLYSLGLKGYDEHAEKAIADMKLKHYIDYAIKTSDSPKLVPMAKELARKIWGEIRQEKTKQDAKNSPTSIGSDGKEIPNDGSGEPPKEWFDEKGLKYDEIKKQLDEQYNEANEKYRDAAQKKSEKSQKFYEKAGKCKNLQRITRVNKTKARNHEDNIKDGRWNNNTEKNHLEKLARNCVKRADDASKEYEKELQEYHKAQGEYNNARDASEKVEANAREQYQKVDSLKREGKYGETAMTGGGGQGHLMGLGALKTEDISVKVDVEIPESLDDTLRNFFVKKRETKLKDEDGTRLDIKRIHRLFSNDRNIFTTQNDIEYKTKVSFVVDNSGSMQSQDKVDIIHNSLASLIDSLNKVIRNDNLPVEVAVYWFNDIIEKVKDFDQEMEGHQIAGKYHTTGGTDLYNSVKKVVEELKGDGSDNERICIVITDAEVSEEEIKLLRNQLETDVQYLFIGIQANERKDFIRELFGDFNITKRSNVIDILTKALTDSIKR